MEVEKEISNDPSRLTKAMRWQIADWLAEDRLPEINAKLENVHPRQGFYLKYIKRLIDIILSLIACIVTFPINLVIGFLTFLDVGKPIFFKQERIGKDGKSFYIIKFRNMRDTRDEHGDFLPAAQRVTKFGKFVRKTSLDELLNFWSILKGDMSLIGPRPLVPEYFHRYNNRHVKRLAVRPGLECPPRSLSNHVWTWHEQFENDIWYVENVCFLTDCRMIYNLFRFALDKKSANARAVSSRGTFMGYDMNGNAINMDDVPQEYIDRAVSEMDDMKKTKLSQKEESRSAIA